MTGPLSGVRVTELSHMVMGPTCGMVLGDLGADVVKVEPPGGDKTRELAGLGAGFFRTFNRNKRSLALDITTDDGRAVLDRLLDRTDVFCENFRPGRMAELGLDHATLSARHERLVYVSHKGFLPGPYEHRKALDEVVQMMGGLAYMTGPPGRPLRTGASVNDIMGGVFGALAAVAALRERDQTGRGRKVESGLFENCAFLVAQHMQQYARTGVEPMPMPNRHVAWAIYEVFETADAGQLFIGVVGDGQWRDFCAMLDRPDWAATESLRTNAGRVEARPWLMPQVRAEIAKHDLTALETRCDAAGIPFARITRPQDLFDDPHLNAGGGLGELVTDTGETTRIPLLPVAVDGRRLTARRALPRVGEHSVEVLTELGLTTTEIDDLVRSGAVGVPADQEVRSA